MRSLRMKMVMIMVILILALMLTTGAFLMSGVGNPLLDYVWWGRPQQFRCGSLFLWGDI